MRTKYVLDTTETTMSVFKVKLQSIKQGLLDMDPSTHPLASGTGNQPATYGQLGESFGEQNPNSGAASLQRQMFVAGPNRSYRLLKDGEVFTDSNYWKRFAYPQVSHEFAFIEVVSDDGSVYSDVPSENVFAVGATETVSTTLDDTAIDFVNSHGGAARFLQVQNLDDTAVITGQLNGDVDITFTLNPGETQIFNNGDLSITLLKLAADAGTPDVSYIASVRSVSTS